MYVCMCVCMYVCMYGEIPAKLTDRFCSNLVGGCLKITWCGVLKGDPITFPGAELEFFFGKKTAKNTKKIHFSKLSPTILFKFHFSVVLIIAYDPVVAVCPNFRLSFEL